MTGGGGGVKTDCCVVCQKIVSLLLVTEKADDRYLIQPFSAFRLWFCSSCLTVCPVLLLFFSVLRFLESRAAIL